MDRRSVESIVKALNEHSVRYLIAGGLAVIAHGHVRFTSDVDIVLDLQADNARRALDALARLGYAPRAPVPIEHFADAQERRRWVNEKGITVFSLRSDQAPSTEIDLFVEALVPFEDAFERALALEVAPGVSATFLGYDDLVALKKKAGRPQDLVDIEQLRAVQEANE